MIKNYMKRFIDKFFKSAKIDGEKQKLILGRLLSFEIKKINYPANIIDVEFSIFSQFGDDGIIQYLINNLDIKNKIFIEFGVEDYTESNTRFLMMNNNWSGFVMDGSIGNIERLQSQWYYWMYNLESKAVFINKDNINNIIKLKKYPTDIGLMHIDLDGNDYYIWEAINAVTPIIVVVEYNSIFGINRPISVIYDENFIRNNAHYSNLLFGSSLRSLYNLAMKKGYSFVGCNNAGNNAYFVRSDHLNDMVREVSIEVGFVESMYRESRDADGNLSLLSKADARLLLAGEPVFNTELHCIEKF
jgi:hypothetical protein